MYGRKRDETGVDAQKNSEEEELARQHHLGRIVRQAQEGLERPGGKKDCMTGKDLESNISTNIQDSWEFAR